MSTLFQFNRIIPTRPLKALFASASLAALSLLAAPAAHAASAQGIAAGNLFNCTLTTGNGVMCWGYNQLGQMGVGAVSTYQTTPTFVTGLSTGASAVAAGGQHACALTTSGTVKCWGRNGGGQLGNGTMTDSPSPVDVIGLNGVTALSLGNVHSCALTASGTVKCWGTGAGGALSNGGVANALTPVDVVGVTGAVGIAAGSTHSCAVLASGAVQCWGANGWGQLGNGQATSSTTRVNAVGISDAVSITAGAGFTCAKSSGGAVKCWGLNTLGQVGNNGSPTVNVLVPTQVSGLTSGVVALASGPGASHSCATLNTNETRCWGQNQKGQLGNGNLIDQKTPVVATGLSGLPSRLSVSSFNSCALIGAQVQCWGDNTYAQLGTGNANAVPFPVSVIGFDGSAPALAPTTLSPVTSTTPLYIWKAVPGATNYHLNVNGAIGTYTAAAVGCDGGVGLCSVPSGTLSAGTYTWYVQGYNSFGDGAWSAATVFKL